MAAAFTGKNVLFKSLGICSKQLDHRFISPSLRRPGNISLFQEKENSEKLGVSIVSPLLQSVVSRAIKTVSEVEEQKCTNYRDEDVTNLIDAVSQRAYTTLSTPPNVKKEPNKEGYSNNPAVKGTALAHSLWEAVIQPWDTAIDATCGNGQDSLTIAQMLFGPLASDATDLQPVDAPKPQLICIDIQEQAVTNTTSVLLQELGTSRFHKSVTVIKGSHVPLPTPRDGRSVGLICYNLGFLPGSDKTCVTQSKSTLSSLADAAVMVRVGGMISVTTYPGTNKEEAVAVRAFLEGLAMFSSRVPWEDNLNDSSDLTDQVKVVVREALQRVATEGSEAQTWRVFEHAALGRPVSPVLIAATRIK